MRLVQHGSGEEKRRRAVAVTRVELRPEDHLCKRPRAACVPQGACRGYVWEVVVGSKQFKQDSSNFCYGPLVAAVRVKEKVGEYYSQT
jgi:hypothetical protein